MLAANPPAVIHPTYQGRSIMKMGNPLQPGTLGSILFTAALSALVLYFYMTIPDKKYPLLMMLLVGLGATAKNYFAYRKAQIQQGHKLIGDTE
jgi:hypothetical protein